jgi:hypothetical protein
MAKTDPTTVMAEYGLPDWRVEAHYPAKPSDWTCKQWHWALVRRSPSYREIYKALQGETKTFVESHRVRRKFGIDAIHPPHLTEAALVNLNRPKHAVFIDSGFCASGSEAERTTTGSGCRDLSQVVTFTVLPIADIDPPVLMPCAVDTTRELKPQLQDLTKKARELQIRNYGQLISAKHHTAKWPLYLRVLDAKEQGATWEEIGGILPKSMRRTAQSARKVWGQAARLRDKLGRS